MSGAPWPTSTPPCRRASARCLPACLPACLPLPVRGGGGGACRRAGTLHPLPTPHPPAQAYEPNYRWDDKYRLSKDEMSKGSGAAVKHGLLQYAYDHAIDRFARLGTEVLTVRQLPSGR